MSGFGERLREARRQKRFTLEQLAELVGSSKAYIWQLENKDEASPSAELLFKLCDALGVLPGQLLQGSAQPGDAQIEQDILFRRFKALEPRDREVILGLMEQMNARANPPKGGSKPDN